MRTRSSLGSALTSAAMLVSSCGVAPHSGTRDIFIEDRGDATTGNARRHPANADERLWTIDMGGCSGHLIAPDYMMTASHCQPREGARYTSGYASNNGQANDVTVTQVVESDRILDYAIMKIAWAGGAHPQGQKYPPLVATQPSDVRLGPNLGEGDEIFTVGFPGDKAGTWGATYSEGRLKAVRGDRIGYDMGIINGNSGGGAWRKSDRMLVSLTNGGPSMLGTPGWDSAVLTNPQSWNHGAAMWEVYAVSRSLKDIFPNGKNRYPANDGGRGDTLPEVFVALGKAVEGAPSNYVLHATAPEGTVKLYFCATDKPDACSEGSTGYTATTPGAAIGSRPRFVGTQATALRKDLLLSFVAIDDKGWTIATRTIQLAPR